MDTIWTPDWTGLVGGHEITSEAFLSLNIRWRSCTSPSRVGKIAFYSKNVYKMSSFKGLYKSPIGLRIDRAGPQKMDNLGAGLDSFGGIYWMSSQ